MAFVNVDLSNFNLSGRGMKPKFKRASEKAFLEHRNKIMPKHFLWSAYDIYPEYGGHKPKAVGKFVNKRKTRSRKDKIRDKKKDTNRERRGHGLNPLWKTGRLRSGILEGSMKIFGSAGNTKLVWDGLPYYTFINPRNQINKVAALESILPSEEKLIARNIEKFLEQELNK